MAVASAQGKDLCWAEGRLAVIEKGNKVSEHVNIWFWKQIILLKNSFGRLILHSCLMSKYFYHYV